VFLRQQVSAEEGKISVNMARLQKQQIKRVGVRTMTGTSGCSIPLMFTNHSKHADKQNVADFKELRDFRLPPPSVIIYYFQLRTAAF
jgi:hypothetical protein